MVSLRTQFVNMRFTYGNLAGKCIGETDTGTLKLKLDDGKEVFATHDEVRPEETVALAQAA